MRDYKNIKLNEAEQQKYNYSKKYIRDWNSILFLVNTFTIVSLIFNLFVQKSIPFLYLTAIVELLIVVYSLKKIIGIKKQLEKGMKNKKIINKIQVQYLPTKILTLISAMAVSRIILYIIGIV